jgi:hypothetical protein
VERRGVCTNPCDPSCRQRVGRACAWAVESCLRHDVVRFFVTLRMKGAKILSSSPYAFFVPSWRSLWLCVRQGPVGRLRRQKGESRKWKGERAWSRASPGGFRVPPPHPSPVHSGNRILLIATIHRPQNGILSGIITRRGRRGEAGTRSPQSTSVGSSPTQPSAQPSINQITSAQLTFDPGIHTNVLHTQKDSAALCGVALFIPGGG